MPFFSRCVALLLLVVAPLCAQQPDLLLTPADPDSYHLPADISIQDAGTSGSLVLAAWGSTRFQPDSSIVNALYFQLVSSGVPIGRPLQLHGDSARPAHFVRVIPAGFQFVVLWTDIRSDRPGLYATRIDTAGRVLERERRISEHTVAFKNLFEVITSGTFDNGWLLLWNGSETGHAAVYGQRLAPDGSFTGAPVEIARELSAVLQYRDLPGMTMLVSIDSFARVVRYDGTLDPRTVPSPRAGAAGYLAPDSSLAVIEEGKLQVYRSLFDSIPTTSYMLPPLAAHASMLAVARDSTGRYGVFSGMATVTGNPGFTRLTMWVNWLEPDGIFGDTSIVYYRSEFNGIQDQGSGYSLISLRTLRSARTLPGCSNSHFMRVLFHHIFGADIYSGPTEGEESWIVKIDADGRASALQSLPVPICSMPQPVPVERISSDTTSTVSLGKDKARLTVMTAAARSKFFNRTPAVTVRHGRLLWTAQQGYYFEWHTLGEILPGPVPASRALVKRYVQPTPTLNSSFTITSRSGSQADHTIENNGFGFVLSSRTVTERGYYQGRSSQSPDARNNSAWRIALPDTGSWTIPRDYFTLGVWVFSEYQVNREAFSFDPNSSQLFGMTVGNDYKKQYIVIDTNGVVVWDKTPAGDTLWGEQFVPITSTRYLLFSGIQARLIVDGKTTKRFTLLDNGVQVGYRRLMGSSFLRYFYADTTRRHLSLQRYSLEGALLDSASLDFPVSPNGINLLQRQADSLIAVVYSTDGIRTTVFDTRLKRVVSDSAVSAARSGSGWPAATFRNDSLFVVWEDRRTAAADISANWIRIPMGSLSKDTGGVTVPGDLPPNDTAGVPVLDGVPQRDTIHTPADPKSRGGTESLTIVAIVPNPAHGNVTVDFTMVESAEAVAELYDPLGSLVLRKVLGRIESGPAVWHFDVDGLGAGSYAVRIRAGNSDAVLRFIVPGNVQ